MTFETGYTTKEDLSDNKKIEDAGEKLNKIVEFTVTTVPSIKIAEIPLYDSRGTILDNPPMFPNVEFIPYKNVSDKICINLNSGSGKLKQDPIIFEESELAFYELFREAHKLNDIEKVLFKTDDTKNLGVSFEIYRLDFAPSSYSDFFGKLRSTVETSLGASGMAPSATKKEKVTENVKYYYTFRLVDRRGIKSNPTPVFEVQMVKDGSATYPIISLYDFEADEKSTQDSFRKILNVTPALSQVSVGSLGYEYDTLSGFSDTTAIGVTEQPLLGETFKLRITSKSTGRAIDLNLFFDIEVVDNTKE